MIKEYVATKVLVKAIKYSFLYNKRQHQHILKVNIYDTWNKNRMFKDVGIVVPKIIETTYSIQANVGDDGMQQ